MRLQFMNNAKLFKLNIIFIQRSVGTGRCFVAQEDKTPEAGPAYRPARANCTVPTN